MTDRHNATNPFDTLAHRAEVITEFDGILAELDAMVPQEPNTPPRQPRRAPDIRSFTRVNPINPFTGRRSVTKAGKNPWAMANRCTLKHKRYEEGIRKLISTDQEIKGTVFSYTLDVTQNIGKCRVYDKDVACICLVTGRVLALYMPTEADMLSQPAGKVLNVTRLFWRRLGYNAKRYKDLTIVETDCCVKVLEPGETWIVPEYGTPFLFKPQTNVEEWTQLPLIDLNIYLDCERIHEDKKYKEKLAEKIRRGNMSPFYGSGTATTSSFRGTGTSNAINYFRYPHRATTASASTIFYHTI